MSDMRKYIIIILMAVLFCPGQAFACDHPRHAYCHLRVLYQNESTAVGKNNVEKSSSAIVDTLPPIITITSHDTSRGIALLHNRETVTLRGKAYDKNGVIKVLINKNEAELDSAGNFSKKILLTEENNKLIIEASDIYGNLAVKELSIVRKVMKQPNRILSDYSDSKYYALIIGNNNYYHLNKLSTAKKDAIDVAKILESQYGFKTKLLINTSRKEIVQELNKFRKILTENDNFLIYYAGHGEYDKIANKAYWLPVDARKDDDTNWIIVDRITSHIKRISAKHVLVISDSCYSGTFSRDGRTDIRSGALRSKHLEKMFKKPSRTLMASGGNEPVSDIGRYSHSVFAEAFLSALQDISNSEFTAEELFYQYIKERVSGNAEQTPEYNCIRDSGHDGGDFVFRRK